MFKRIYFELYLGNSEKEMGVYYGSLNLTFSYYASAGDIVSVGNYTIRGFYQGLESSTKRKGFVAMTEGFSWQEISKNQSLSPTSNVVFRVDLETEVKFREMFSKVKSKRRKIMAWAKVEVDPITGKMINKEFFELEHLIKDHSSGRDTFLYIFLIVALVLSPCWCFCFLGCFCKLIGR